MSILYPDQNLGWAGVLGALDGDYNHRGKLGKACSRFMISYQLHRNL